MAIYQHKLAPDFSEGVDRKLLKEIRDRFLSINTARMDRANEGLSRRHQDILRVLPLLYQVNHPLMPGYVSMHVPRGVSGYVPDKTALAIARSFSQTFKFNADRRHTPEIFSLFMMGSTGTLAHSEASDVDLWLCCAPELSLTQRQALKAKAELIDQWANGLGLELHTFVMDAEAFRGGLPAPQMDTESSGSAQHVLLLDEFYRTAILLAGRYPLWWLVPPAMDQSYAETTGLLLSKRFIKQTEVIDFGAAHIIPKGELVGAGLWQLYKSLDAPYKSVLKLLLAEVYAQEMPRHFSLSWEFKQAVYDDQLETDFLDPYLMVYRRLERYLLDRGEMKRLDLIRKSFYVKVNKKLSQRPSGRRPSWQRQLLGNVTGDWAWSEQRFKYLDGRATWKVDQVISERQEVLTELSYSYRFLSTYARVNNISSSITREDLSLLGRKLYAIFQRKAGKIERVNPGIAPSLWEENLAIHHASSQPYHSEQNAWLLYRDLGAAADASFHPVLKKSASLIELLAWLFFNGILNRSTRLSLVPGHTSVSLHEVQSIIHALEQSIQLPLPSVEQSAFLDPAKLKELVLFINVGVDPMASMTDRGMHRLSDRTDSLGYSSQRHNLVKTIDQISLNTWHEMSAHRYEMGETLMQTLQSYLQVSFEQRASEPCRLHVYCYCPQRAEAIAARVRALFEDARAAFIEGSGSRSLRYVIEIEKRYYILTQVEGQFRFFVYPNQSELWKTLASPVQTYSPVKLDRYALEDEHVLRSVLDKKTDRGIQVFFRVLGQFAETFVLDEFGSVARFEYPCDGETVFLSRLLHFVRNTLERQILSGQKTGEQDVSNIRMFRFQVTGSNQVSFTEVQSVPEWQGAEVVATGSYQGADLRFDLSMDFMEFTYLEHGERQWDALLHYLHSLPDATEQPLPAISDISFPVRGMGLNQQELASPGLLDCLRAYEQLNRQLSSAIH